MTSDWLTKRRRENLAKAFFDVGKLILATVVLGRFVSEKPITLDMLMWGFAGVIGCFVIATILDKGD